MRIMALDIGGTRTGVAISDPDERVATPLAVLATSLIAANGPAWRTLLSDWEPELLVCGLPYTLSGEEGPQAAALRAKAQDIASRAHLPLQFADERLSSVAAKRILRENGMSEKDMRGKVDMIAASIFLQAWLDARAPREQSANDVETQQEEGTQA